MASGLPAFSLKCSDQTASRSCQDPSATRDTNTNKCEFIGLHNKQLPLGTPFFRASAIAFRSRSLSLCLCLCLSLSLSFSPLSPPLPSSPLFFPPPSPSLPQLSSTYLCLASYSSKQAASLYVEAIHH